MEIRKDQEKKTNRVAGERRADDARRIADALKRRGRISLRVHGASMQPWVRSKDIALIRRIRAISFDRTHGASMQPWVRSKDIALIRRISIENVRCGDVVLFRRENHLFVHRIVEKRGSLNAAQLLSKGDAHPTSDGVVQEQELLGRVMRIYRNGRRIDLDAPRQLALGQIGR